ncbi:MAG TPA: hypothetical protein VMS86_02505, partial [Thermoanaerobaculia bacterium]|nr:hypothetical protein [Thermoanaerobaculia bacterium]
MAASSRRLTTAGWWALAALLAILLVVALTGSRERWPGLVGDEATYLMQAQSLAWDGDLRFAAEDLDRFRERRGHSPEVILQSGDRGERIVYGKPFLYAAAIAPLVRMLGERGAVLANVLALGVAGLLAALALIRQGNPAGPWWIAVALFGSVAFGHVFWIHPDLFLMAAAASGLALAHLLRCPSPREAGRGGRGRALAWFAAGALLAIPAAWRPPYLVLLLPGAFLAAGGVPGGGAAAVTAGRTAATRVGAFGAGAAVVAALTLGGQQLVSGSWSPYAGERRGFSELEGFPGIDFPAGEWSARVESKGNTSWLREGAFGPGFSPALNGWNATYLLLGRTVGLVPYFLPALAALLRRRFTAAALVQVIAGLAVPLAFLLVRPFNFYGGAGALGNRYFLPAYPMFWFTGAGPLRCAVTLLAAAPFLWPLWSAPAAYPLVPGEGYRYVGPAAHLLPVESTQRHVKAPGRADVVHGTLWVRFLDGGLEPVDDEATLLALGPGRAAEIFVGSGSPLESVTVEVFGAAPGELRVSGPG